MTLNVGIIGSGGIVKKAHLPAFSKDPRVQVKAIAARNLKRLKTLSRTYDIPACYSNWKTMLKKERLDAVTIALPNSLHGRTTILALKEGMHVFVEKPLAVNEKEVENIVKTSEETEKFVMVHQTLRFNSVVNALKRIIQEGTIGNITKIYITHGHPGPKSKWYYNIKLSGGGVLLDLGIHAIDTIRYLFPDEKIEEISTYLSAPEPFIEHIAKLFLKTRNGLEGRIKLSWAENIAVGTIDLVGRKGKIFSSFWPDQDLFINGILTSYDFSKVEYESEPFKHFIDSIESGKEPMCSCHDNALSMALIFKAYEKSEVRRT